MGGSPILAVPTPFYPVYSSFNNISNNQGVVIAARVVQSGDGTIWPNFAGNAGGITFGIFEFSGAHSVQVSASQGAQTGVNWPFFAGSATNAYTFYILENDSTNGYSSITGASLLFDGTNTANNHPSIIATIAAGSPSNATAIYTGTNFSNSLFVTTSVVP
jgi:hypothetical protein